jgi:hypothetical protein
VKIQVEVFWVVTPFSVVVNTNVSEDHAASIFTVMVFTLKMEAAWSSETLVS